MENSKLEEKEIYEVDSKKYTVITRISENCLLHKNCKMPLHWGLPQRKFKEINLQLCNERIAGK